MNTFVELPETGDVHVTSRNTITVRIVCNPYMWCGQKFTDPVRTYHSDRGFSMNDIKKLVMHDREKVVRCDHIFFEGVTETDPGVFVAHMGS